MQTESFGKVLPQLLLPYVRQWADRSGMTVLSKLLVDEQFLQLISKYADELIVPLSQFGATPGNGHGSGNGSRPHTNGDAGLANLNARVSAMEEQLLAQQALFELLRTKSRPLALALGCCPECVVGVDGCPKCLGRSAVGLFPPDQTSLRALIVNPLAARGVPLTLGETPESRLNHQSEKKPVTKKRSKSWPKK